MSALGDYVHLTKTNYDKYGINRPDDPKAKGGVIAKQIQGWKNVHDHFAKSIAYNPKDIVEQQLKEQIVDYKIFLKQLAEDPKMETQKGIVLQEILGDYYEFLKNSIQINLATGAVNSTGGKQTVLGNTDADFIRRMAYNKQEVRLGKNVNNIQDIITMIEGWRTTCNEYFTFLNKKEGKLKDIDIKKANIEYGILKGRITNAIKQLQTETLQVTRQGVNQVVITKGMRNAAKALVQMLEMLKVPSLNSIKGKVGEICYKSFIKQAQGIAVKLATETTGEAITKGGFKNVEFYAPAAEHFLEELKLNSRTNLSVEQEIGKDKVTKCTLSYSSSSQRKADVVLSVDIQGGKNSFQGNVGVSIKNYTMDDLHLVSGSPLLLFLVNNLSVDNINHYLNLFAESEDTVANLKEAKTMAATAVKVMILYAAASGANVGKGAENIADYLLLNVPNAKNEEDQITIVNIKKLVKQLAKEGKYSVTTDNKDLANISFPNVKDPSDISGGKRIAKLIMSLHQAKIYVTIPRQAIIAAGKNH